MAKGNMLLGYSRGSVGDVVFSRANGEQLQRARNRNPKNPQTFKQVAQRGRFTAAVTAFTNLQRGQFYFAYEDKRYNESDYNAFMRNNVKLAPVAHSARTSADKIIPWNWIISRGSLPSMNASVVVKALSGNQRAAVSIPVNGVALDSWEACLKALSNLGILVGDILTLECLCIDLTATTVNANIITNGSAQKTPSVVQLAQFIVPATVDAWGSVDGVQLSVPGGYIDFSENDNTITFYCTSVIVPANMMVAGALVHSRVTPSSTMVSSERLDSANTTWLNYVRDYSDSIAMSSLDYNADAIIKGGL